MVDARLPSCGSVGGKGKWRARSSLAAKASCCGSTSRGSANASAVVVPRTPERTPEYNAKEPGHSLRLRDGVEGDQPRSPTHRSGGGSVSLPRAHRGRAARHLARDRLEELQELSELVFYFYNLEESPVELGETAWAAMEAHMRDLSSALGGGSPHVGVTTWSQRNFGTLYMVTSPTYQALL
jgi:hypothetical protein